MCGRYTITAKPKEIETRFEVEVTDAYKPRFNAAPTQLLPVITNENPDGMSFFYWGLIPEWSKSKAVSIKLFNAQAEAINEKPTFKNALKQHRCIVPADSFYEWKRVSKKSKIPYRFLLNNNNTFSFAGLWEEFEDDNDEVMHTFTIITTEPNEMVQPIHERMPVMLTPDTEKIWLDNASSEHDLLNVLLPFDANGMTNYTVSSQVNNVANDLPSIIAPSAPADQFGNYSLFD